MTVVVNAVKEGVQIEVNDPFLALLYLASRLVYRLLRVAVRPESVAVGGENAVPRSGPAPALSLVG